jgi:hypothetical protein
LKSFQFSSDQKLLKSSLQFFILIGKRTCKVLHIFSSMILVNVKFFIYIHKEPRSISNRSIQISTKSATPIKSTLQIFEMNQTEVLTNLQNKFRRGRPKVVGAGSWTPVVVGEDLDLCWLVVVCGVNHGDDGRWASRWTTAGGIWRGCGR